MKLAKTLVLCFALLTSFTTVVAEDEANGSDAVESVETLRIQLLEAESKQADLEARAQQLDEDLKPENIERALAGIGSTKPEELRELRRRQLTIERDSVRGQLRLVARSRERLESVIRTAETRAYQESAGVAPPLNQLFAAPSVGPGRRLALFTGLLAVVFLVIVIGIARRAVVLIR
jgi:hypothetical protein